MANFVLPELSTTFPFETATEVAFVLELEAIIMPLCNE
jgi:hypothetical protein